MSGNVDERVVQMSFDNKQFEKGIRHTMATLDEFKEKLDYEDTRTGVDELGKSIESMSESGSDSLSKMEEILGRIEKRFSFVGQKAMELKNKLFGLGKELTTGQLSKGFTKYESLMNATRTIMNANPGKTVEQVDEVLDRLVKYTDETSYNLSDMVTNMSSFISAGVDLDKAEIAMEGIANACAHAGKGIKEAQGPMLVLSKVMSSGALKNAMDFNSLQRYGIITPQFTEEIFKAAKALGVLDEKGKILTGKGKGKVVKNMETLRDTLHYGWLSTDVMTKAFAAYADNTQGIGKVAYRAAMEAKTFTDVLDALKDAISTGWATSFKYIFGNVEEAAQFFTRMINAFAEVTSSISETRNEILKGWKEGGGRNELMQSLHNIWVSITKIGSAIATGVTNVTGIMTSSGLIDLTKQFERFTRSIYAWLMGNAAKEGEKIAPRIVLIRMAVEGLVSVFKYLIDVGKGVFGFFGRIVSDLFPGTDTFMVSIGKLGRAVSNFFKTMRESGFIQKFFSTLYEKIRPVVVIVREFISAIGKLLECVINLVTGSSEFSKSAENISKRVEDIKKKISDFLKPVQTVFRIVSRVIAWIAQSKSLDQLVNRLKVVGAFLKLYIKAVLKKIVDDVKNWFAETWPVVQEKISELFTKVKSWVLEKISAVSTWFMESIPKAKEAVVNWFKNLIKPVEQSEEGPEYKPSPFLEGFRKFVSGLPEKWEKLKEIVGNLASKVGPWIKERFERLKQALSFDNSKKVDFKSLAMNLLQWVPLITVLGFIFGALKNLSAISMPKLITIIVSVMAFSEFISKVTDALSVVARIITPAIEVGLRVIDSIREVATNVGLSLAGVPELLYGMRNQIVLLAVAFGLRGIAGAIKKFVKHGVEPITQSVGKVSGAVGALAEAIKKKYEPVKKPFIESFRDFCLGIAAIALSVAVSIKILDSIMNVQDGEKRILIAAGVIAAMTTFMFVISVIAAKVKGLDNGFNALLKMSSSFLFVSIALKLIIDKVIYLGGLKGEAMHAFLIGSVLLTALMAFVSLASGIGLRVAGGKSASNDSWKAILAMTAAVVLASFRMIKLANQLTELFSRENGVWGAIGALTFIVSLMGMMGLCLKMAGENENNGGPKGFIALGAAMIAMLWVVRGITSVVKGMDFVQWVAVFGPIMAIMFFIGDILSEAGKMDADAGKVAIGILLMLSAMILVIGYVAADMANVPIGNLLSFMVPLVALLGMMALLFNTVSKSAENLNGKTIFAMFLEFAGVAGMIYVLGLALEKVKGVDWTTIAAFGGVVSALMLIMSLLMAASKDLNMAGVMGILVMFIGVIGLVGISALAIKLIPKDATNEIIALGLFVGGLMLIGSLLMAASSLVKWPGVVGMLVMFIGTIGLLLVSVMAIKAMPNDAVEKAVTLGVFVGGLMLVGGLLMIMSRAVKWAGIIGMLVSLVGVIALVMVSALAIRAMPDDCVKKALTLGIFVIVMAAVAAVLVATSKLVNGTVIKAAAIIAAALAILGIGIAIFVSLVSSSIETFSGALFTLSTALEDWVQTTGGLSIDSTIVALDIISKLIAKATEMVGVNYDGVHTFSTETYRLGASLRNFSNISVALNHEKITEALGIADEIKTMATTINSVPEIKDMSTVIANIGGAIKLYYSSLSDAMTDEEGNALPTGTLDTAGIKQMFIDLANDMPSDEDIAKVTKFSDKDGSGLTNFAVGITNLGTALKTYGTDVGSIKQDDLKNANTVVSFLSDIQSSLPTDTVISTVLGTFTGKRQSLADFGLDIEALGGALTTYAKSLTGEELEAGIATANGTVKLLSQINESLPKQGGLESFLTGNKSLSSFGLSIRTLGKGLAGYVEFVSGKDFSNAYPSVRVVKALASVQNELKPQGVLSGLFGTGTFGNFAENIGKVGEGMGKYVDAISGKSFSEVESSMKPLSEFAKVHNELKSNDSFFDKILGQSTFTNFAENIGKVGEGMGKYATAVSGKSFDNVEASLNPLKQLMNIQSSATSNDSFLEKILGQGTFDNLVGNLGNIGTGMNDFVTNLNKNGATYDKNVLDTAVGAVASLGNIQMGKDMWSVAELAKNNILKDLGSGVNEMYNNMKNVNTQKISEVANAIVSLSTIQLEKNQNGAYSYVEETSAYLTEIGSTLAGVLDDSFASTIKDSKDVITEALQEILNNTIAIITSYNDDYETLGDNLVIGLANGVKNNSFKLSHAMDYLSQQAEKRFRAYWGIHSPSTLGEFLTGMIPEGGILGLENVGGDLLNKAGDLFGFDLGGAVGDGLDFVNGLLGGKLDELKGTLGDKLGGLLGIDLGGLLGGESEGGLLGALGLDDFIEGITEGEMGDFLSFLKGGGDGSELTLEDGVVNLGSGSGFSFGGDGSSGSGGGGGGGGSGSGVLGKKTATVSSGGLNLSMTDGYTVGDIVNRIDRLENAITNMKIVLDSGVLVGAVAPGMNSEFANYLELDGRWN